MPEPSATSDTAAPVQHFTLVINFLSEKEPIAKHSFTAPDSKGAYRYAVDYMWSLTTQRKKLSIRQVVASADLRDGVGVPMMLYTPTRGWFYGDKRDVEPLP